MVRVQAKTMNYEPVIGLEVHIELGTHSKMFCACSANYFGAKPNTHTCPICLGLPGAMPKANRVAIEYAQKLGLALSCQVQLSSKFDRKNYFYPDLVKGFQISQYDLPFSQKGFLLISEVSLVGKMKKIDITRAHLEEDTGKLTHATVNGKRVTLIDFNRSGVPLLEVVSEPDMTSAEEAKAYAQKLQQIVRYLEISDADMEKGSMRIEPNISLRPIRHPEPFDETQDKLREGSKTKDQDSSSTTQNDRQLPNYKVELKNINSFKFAEKAIEYEIKRQSEILDQGETPVQETRGWNEAKSLTFSQRTKELAHDYRYFPEPDLPPFVANSAQISKLKRSLPELPDAKLAKFKSKYKLSDYDAGILTYERNLADFFQEAYKAYPKGQPKRLANWLIGELAHQLNEEGKTVKETSLLPASLAELLYMMDQGKITAVVGKEIFAQMIKTGKAPRSLIKDLKVKIISQDELAKIVGAVLRENPQAIADYQKGKSQILDFLIGQVQRQTKGTADPNLVRTKIIEKIAKDN